MGVTTKTNYTKFQLKANKAEAGPEAAIVCNRERDDLFNFTGLQLQTASLKWAGLGWAGWVEESRGEASDYRCLAEVRIQFLV